MKHRMFLSNIATFDSRNLEIGDMMLCTEPSYEGIVLKTYECLVLLNRPSCTWDHRVSLSGRKLKSGEGITLVQE